MFIRVHQEFWCFINVRWYLLVEFRQWSSWHYWSNVLTILNILEDDIDDKCSTNDFFWLPHEVLTSCLFKNTSDISCGWKSYAQTVQYNNYLKCEKTKMPSNSIPKKRKASVNTCWSAKKARKLIRDHKDWQWQK